MKEAKEALSDYSDWSGLPLAVIAHAAARTKRPEDYPEEYNLLQTAFDHAHYFSQRPDVARARLDPVAHYMRAGYLERIDPTPWFNGAKWSKAHNDQLDGMTPFGHWLTFGNGDRRAVSPIGDPAARAAAKNVTLDEYQTTLDTYREDLRARLKSGELGRMVDLASGYEPLVAHSWTEASAPRIQPIHDERATARLEAFRGIYAAAGGKRADAVVIVGDPRWGAARRMEGHIAHGLRTLPDVSRIAVITTDKPGDLPPAKVPEGGVHIDLSSAVSGLPPPDQRRILVETLRALRPEVGFAVNSRLTWDALGEYGPSLTNTVPIYGCMFCNDRDVFGRWGGYPASRFYRHFDDLAGICTDSHALKAELEEQFMVPPNERARIKVLSAPVDPSIPVRGALPDRSSTDRPQVFWAGRLDPQKRLDVVYAIARQMPEVDFRLWGKPVAGGVDPQAHRPDNVHLVGTYGSFEELPMEEADAWLYTSEWDGVPSILLEVAMTGVPIVGARVGGTGEVLRPDMSWPVADFLDVDGHVSGLRGVLSDPDAGLAKANALRDHLIAERTEAQYHTALSDMLERARHG